MSSKECDRRQSQILSNRSILLHTFPSILTQYSRPEWVFAFRSEVCV